MDGPGAAGHASLAQSLWDIHHARAQKGDVIMLTQLDSDSERVDGA